VTDDYTTTEEGNEDESTLDIPALIASIQRGAHIGQIVASLRPSWQQLGEQLINLVTLHEHAIKVGKLRAKIADMEALVAAHPNEEDLPDLDERYGWEPWLVDQQSQARAEYEALIAAGWPQEFLQPPHDRNFGRTLLLVRRLIEAALDHLHSIGILMQAERAGRAPIALSRVALEAAARAWYLLDPAIGPQERIVRTLNAELDALDEKVKAARRSGEHERMRQAGTEMKDLLREAVKQGAKRSRIHGQRLDRYERASANIDELLQQNDGSIYHILSTMVHSHEDEGFRLLLGLAHDEGNPHQGQQIALYVLPAILALVEACKRLDTYTGWDISDHDSTNELVLGFSAHGAGFADDHYRELAEQQLDDPPA